MLASAMMAMFFLSYINTAQMPVIYAQKQVLYKQQAANFFPPSVLPLALSLAHLPFLACEVLLCTLPAYFMVGFTPRHRLLASSRSCLHGAVLHSFVALWRWWCPARGGPEHLAPVRHSDHHRVGVPARVSYAPATFQWCSGRPRLRTRPGIANLEFLSSQWDVRHIVNVLPTTQCFALLLHPLITSV